MLTKQTKFILAIVLQMIIIFAIIIFYLPILTTGKDVLLKIVPVDPRDLLRGDYITFQYDISNINSYNKNDQQIKNKDTVYIILRQNGKYYIAKNVQKTKPIGNDLFIKGVVESGGLESQTDLLLSQHLNNSNLHIIYGIEQYFIPEGKGRDFSFWNKEAAARVVIDENGNPALKQIYIDDKPWP
ncbi:MAG: GDYXXLXY domain-containing protein [bacterium]